MALLAWALLMVTFILWGMGRSHKKSAQRLEEWYDTKWNPTFCVIPGYDERCFTYKYDLPQPDKDKQFWEMVDFVNEQAWLKKSEQVAP